MSGKAQITAKKAYCTNTTFDIHVMPNDIMFQFQIGNRKNEQINLYFLNMQSNCFIIVIEIILVKFKHWL